MRPTSSTLALILSAVMLGAGATYAEDKSPKPPAQSDTAPTTKGKAPATAEPKGKPASHTVYVPPPRGAVGARTGGGTRGRANAPRISVLAPDHVGLTTREQPAVAWYLSAPTQAPIEFTVIAHNAIEPLAVKRLPNPTSAGIHVVDLAAQGIRLEEGTAYDWYVALVLDPKARDADAVAGGAIQLRSAPPALLAELTGAEPSYRVLARHGIWYDAIADLSAAIAAANDGAPALRAERSALLEQVGVGAVALYERERGR